MLAVVPAVAVGAVLYGRRVRRLAREVQDALAAAGEVAEETISGLRTVRSFDAEGREAERYGAAVWKAFETARRRASAPAPRSWARRRAPATPRWRWSSGTAAGSSPAARSPRAGSPRSSSTRSSSP